MMLIRGAQASQPDAYSQIVLRFQAMAYGYAYAILGDFLLAEDAAQEAFIEAYQRLPELREPLAFPVWFKRILFKHCDRLTRRKRPEWMPLEEMDALASPLPSPAEVAENHELAQRVQDAIQGLPVDQRLATTLFYINGYSQQEIADFLEVPAKTVCLDGTWSPARLPQQERLRSLWMLSKNHYPTGLTARISISKSGSRMVAGIIYGRTSNLFASFPKSGARLGQSMACCITSLDGDHHN